MLEKRREREGAAIKGEEEKEDRIEQERQKKRKEEEAKGRDVRDDLLG